MSRARQAAEQAGEGAGEVRGRDLLLVLGSSTGGIGTHVRSLARGLASRGARVVVAGPAATESLFAFGAAGARFQQVEIPAGPGVADLAAARRLRLLMANAELTHAHGLRAGLLSGLAPRRSPLVVTLHNAVLGSRGRRGVLRLLEQFVVRRADVTLGASADLVARALELGAKAAILGPVAPPQSAAPTGTRDKLRADLNCVNRPLVLALGRLHPQKCFDVLIEAAGLLARTPPAEGVPLVLIAGEGPLAAALSARIAAANAPVVLLGRRDDVPDLLAAADVVVLPSAWEARALVAQEALRAGKPLVATAVGGIPELVGDAALLVRAGDAQALAAGLRSVLDSPELAATLAGRGLARSLTWPDEAAVVDLVTGVYVELLGRRA